MPVLLQLLFPHGQVHNLWLRCPWPQQTVFTSLKKGPVEAPFQSDSFPRRCGCLRLALSCRVYVVRRGNPAQKCLASITQVLCLCILESHSERCQSPHTGCIRGSFVRWQEDRRDKTARRLASISPPPGAPLDAVHVARCFKFLTLEELSCVISLRSLFCLLTGILSDCWGHVFYLCWLEQNFQAGEMKEVQGIPFRGMYVWDGWQLVSADHLWVKEVKGPIFCRIHFTGVF